MIEDAERAGLLDAGRHDHRGHVRQHGHGARHRRGRQGLQVHLHDDRQAVEGEDRRAAGVRRRGHRLPDERRSGGPAVLLLGVVPRSWREVPNAWKANQYDNLVELAAHYEQTGPEIWEQTDGRVTHLVVGVGTGGTVSGAGRYLKEQNPAIKVLGDRHLRLGVQEVQGDRDLRQERDLSLHHGGHRRGLPAAGTWTST